MEAAVLKRMAEYFAHDTKRINHALKVYGFAVLIAGGENLSPKEALTVRIAAILHDIGIHEAERKHGSSAGKYQEMEGPAIAREILENFSIGDDTRERILYLIGNHHSYSKIDGMDFQVLVEADFLVNIFEDGMNKETIRKIEKNIFQTNTGSGILSAMFL
jgi:CRISPR/Cas system-associated endonuclease Cas3-HD